MEDKAPDDFIFDSIKGIEENDNIENVLELKDIPSSDLELPVTSEIYKIKDTSKYIEEEISENSNDDLLNLHEPPMENKDNHENPYNTISNEAINQFVHNFIEPIVKEAIEIQKAENDDSTSDELKADFSGDKKSEKSLSDADDGFEHVKVDDINSTSNMDQSTEETQMDLDGVSSLKDTDEDLVLCDTKIEYKNHEYFNKDKYIQDIKSEEGTLDSQFSNTRVPFLMDFKIEDNVHDLTSVQFQYESYDDIIDDSIVPVALLSTNSQKELNEPIKEDEDYGFDSQGIIDASDNSRTSTQSFEKLYNSLVYSSGNNISQKCKEVICWKNPILSTVVLSAILLIELGLMCDYSIISLLAYSGLFLLFSSFFYKFAIKFNLLRRCEQSNCTISISGEDIQMCVDCVLKWIEYLFNEIRSLAYVVSYTKNLKAFIFFWVMSYIGQWFNLLSLIFMGTIILFSLPIVYITNEEKIDQLNSKMRDQIKGSINKLKGKFQQLINRR